MNYEKKRKIYFYSLLIFFAISATAIITAFIILDLDTDSFFLIFFSAIIPVLIILFILRRKFDFYNFITKYEVLIKNSTPKNKKIDFSSSKFNLNVTNQNFIFYKSFNSFSLYYKFTQVLKNSKRSKSAIIAIIINGNSKVNDLEIQNAINDFEDTFYKTEKFRNHIIIQFKNVHKIFQNDIDFAQNISFTKPTTSHYLIIINIISSQTENQIYYLNSKKHSPNIYYEYALDEIDKLLK